MSELTLKQTKQILQSDIMQSKLREIVGKNIGAFTSSIIQIQQSNDMLKKAEPNSIIGAAITAATLNLPLNNSLGFAYIVPFYDGKTKTTKAQFQIGAKGFKQLAIRSGEFLKINETDVREGEIINRNRMTGEIEFNFIQDENERNAKNIIGYVSYFELRNGFSSTYYMTVEELEIHAKTYSQTYKKGFGNWKDNFDAMAKKTVVKLNLSKNAPLSIEMQKGIESDQGIVNAETEDIEYVDNSTIEIQEEIPTLTDNEFIDLYESVKSGNMPKETAIEDYNLTDEQLEELQKLK